MCKTINFSGSFGVHVPLAFDVAFFFKCVEEGVYCAGTEVDAKAFADVGDYLVAVHGLLVEKLEYDHVE